MLKMAKKYRKRDITHVHNLFFNKNDITFDLTLKLTFWP